MNRINQSNDQSPYSPAVIEAVKVFRASKPWRGTVDERKVKFQTLHEALCAAQQCDWNLNMDRVPDQETQVGNGGLLHETKDIVLLGKLSVVTYLFCFAGAAFEFDYDNAFNWAQTLYRRMFPRSAERMTFVDGMVLKEANRN